MSFINRVLCLFLFVSLTAATARGGDEVSQRLAAGLVVPQRIVSLGPVNTENVYLLGAEDRLVGVTEYCVRPEAAKGKEKIGTVMHFSLEHVIALQPDLVLATGLTNDRQIKRLAGLGIAVERFAQPGSFEKSCDHLLRLGRLLALEVRAVRIVGEVREEVERIRRRVTHKESPKVFFQIGTRPLFGAAPDSFTNDYIRFAGAKNILGDQKSGRTRFEKVVADNPDVIIIAIMGSETGLAGEEKQKWQRVKTLSAARHGRIHIIDPDIACSPSPATFAETLNLVANYLHTDIQFGPIK